MPTIALTRSSGFSRLRARCQFPDPVNEVAARVVAGGVVVLVVVTLATGTRWLTAVVAYGFLARVLAGPTFSPLGQLATRLIAPALPIRPRLVPGPPKRFAQGIGAVFSTAALGLTATGQWTAAEVLLGTLAAAASLEAALGFCLGCRVFAALMRLGIIPASACPRCAPAAQPPQPVRPTTRSTTR